ncbi:MFS transporter [Microbacterium sp. NPDC096154]|uniref:MFS transporter n=1 Tax=Microbacterium sp. NPDC096154 TaxID=3155549 RepID=UPI00332419DA
MDNHSASSETASGPSSAADLADPADEHRFRPGARRAVIAGIVGTIIEWYDYALYGAAASVVIAPLFFTGSESATQLAAFATFAVGFVARPLGGVLIGHMGDRVGRRPAMLLTVILMGAATVGMGLLPTAAAIGLAAPILLVLLRLVQGFGAGAELAGAATMVSEFAGAKRRGIITSLILACPPAGISLATLAFFLASSAGPEALLEWAWRVPFLASIVLFALALYIRSRLEETPEYRAAMASGAAKQRKVPFVELLRRDPAHLLVGFLSITGHNALNYIMAAFAVTVMVGSGMAPSDALLAVTLGTLAAVVLTPLAGILSDRIGAWRVLAIGSVLGALYAYPLFAMLTSGSFGLSLLGLAVGYGLIISCTSGAQGAFLTGLFPAERRFSGVGLAREVNGALVAGFSPLIAAALVAAAGGETWLAALYLAACCAVSAIAVVVHRVVSRRGVAGAR